MSTAYCLMFTDSASVSQNKSVLCGCYALRPSEYGISEHVVRSAYLARSNYMC